MTTKKYKVTGPLGVRNKGEIINCKVIAFDSDQGVYLVYHPANAKRQECGCYEFSYEDDDGYLVTIDNTLYVNDL